MILDGLLDSDEIQAPSVNSASICTLCASRNAELLATILLGYFLAGIQRMVGPVPRPHLTTVISDNLTSVFLTVGFP